MSIDTILAVLGAISTIIGLLTGIIQLIHAIRFPQENRSPININIIKWLKWGLILFGFLFIVILAYREWEVKAFPENFQFWLFVLAGVAAFGLAIYFLRNFLGWIIPVLLVLALIFQWPRDALMDLVNRPEVSMALVGMETARSLRVSQLEGWEVCDLKPESSYTFVKATTEKLYGDDISYRVRGKESRKEQVMKITGMVVSSPEKLPYPDAKYAFGILLNNTPPKRKVTTDGKGCLQGRFNTHIAELYEMDPIHMGFTLRN